MILHIAENFAEPLKMDNLPFAQEADGVADLWILNHPKDVVIRYPGFLLCRQILE